MKCTLTMSIMSILILSLLFFFDLGVGNLVVMLKVMPGKALILICWVVYLVNYPRRTLMAVSYSYNCCITFFDPLVQLLVAAVLGNNDQKCVILCLAYRFKRLGWVSPEAFAQFVEVCNSNNDITEEQLMHEVCIKLNVEQFKRILDAVITHIKAIANSPESSFIDTNDFLCEDNEFFPVSKTGVSLMQVLICYDILTSLSKKRRSLQFVPPHPIPIPQHQHSSIWKRKISSQPFRLSSKALFTPSKT